ncbi:hypothetical protein PM082_000689 [Marasmius tenuissimus]|nr:hypothetical protein PM082_000689 [Marasmius tenuissimus]
MQLTREGLGVSEASYACMVAAKALSAARILTVDTQGSRLEFAETYLSGMEVGTYVPVAKQLARPGDDAGAFYEE